ncbi:MAG: hypothetical protein H6825_16365 [Planctomycetes bacterium]|nr:hypothetical protein [Planctomycetota bacterium]
MNARHHALVPWLPALLLVALCASASAQDEAAPPPAAASSESDEAGDWLRVQTVVTSVSVGQVYFEVGRLAGVEPGDEAWVYPIGGASVKGEVAAVSSTSCRVLLDDEGDGIAIGDRAEVVVPVARLQIEGQLEDEAAGVPQGDGKTIPDHPPWTMDASEFDASQPLLTAVDSPTRAERPMEVRGRSWFTYDVTKDGGFVDRTYTLSRLGAEAWLENAFGKGGTLHVDGEVFHRSSSIDGSTDTSETKGRLDRASWSWGGTRDEPRRLEVGRFLQHEFPELGLLDGVEVSRRDAEGDRIGASVGYMPEPFADQQTGSDSQVALFMRDDGGGEDDLALGAALQGTWHKGKADRQLVLGTAEYTPDGPFSMRGAVWADYYGPNDTVKKDGFEFTEVRLSGTYRIGSRSGVSVNGSRLRYPELLRNEFSPITAEALLDNQTTRVGLSAWQQVTDDVRVDERVDRWTDQDDSGGSAELRTRIRNVPWDRGALSLAVFTRTGGTSDGDGFRVGVSRAFDGGSVDLTSEFSTYTSQDGINGGSIDEMHRILRASVFLSISSLTSVSIFLEDRAGDLDSTHLGVFLQRRF